MLWQLGLASTNLAGIARSSAWRPMERARKSSGNTTKPGISANSSARAPSASKPPRPLTASPGRSPIKTRTAARSWSRSMTPARQPRYPPGQRPMGLLSARGRIAGHVRVARYRGWQRAGRHVFRQCGSHRHNRVPDRPPVDFNWGAGSPDPALGSAGFSARWPGKVLPQYSEIYSFHANTSDGVRLWVNNQLIIDHWVNQAATESSGTILLTANQAADLKMECYSVSGTGLANLAWSSASTPNQTVPRGRFVCSRRFHGASSSASGGRPRARRRGRPGWNAAPTAGNYTSSVPRSKGGPMRCLPAGSRPPVTRTPPQPPGRHILRRLRL